MPVLIKTQEQSVAAQALLRSHLAKAPTDAVKHVLRQSKFRRAAEMKSSEEMTDAEAATVLQSLCASHEDTEKDKLFCQMFCTKIEKWTIGSNNSPASEAIQKFVEETVPYFKSHLHEFVMAGPMTPEKSTLLGMLHYTMDRWMRCDFVLARFSLFETLMEVQAEVRPYLLVINIEPLKGICRQECIRVQHLFRHELAETVKDVEKKRKR